MGTWLLENIATILISLILLAAVAGIVVKLIKDKKKGNASCGCGCSNCAMSAHCHSRK